MNLITLFTMSLLSQNVVLTKFLGICPFVGTSEKEKSALGMGFSVMVVVVVSSLITYFLYYQILLPTNMTHLTTLVFILVIACMVQIVELLLKQISPTLYQSLGIYLPLITTNCAVLGITLLNVQNHYSLLETIVYSMGSSMGFTIVLFVYSSVRERLKVADVPKSFQGYPIAFIVAAIMGLLFTRYVGV